MKKKNNTTISETKTENLFRKFYGADTFIEKSAIPKSFGFKSKKGTDYKGYPDFFLDCSDYVVVVEAKANDQEKAKNEVIWYMMNNKVRKTKDVVGLAFSGQTYNTLKCNYYLLPQNSSNLKEFGSDNSFHKLKKLDELYMNCKYGDAVSDEELTSTLKGINETLNKFKVRDTERSLFFSGIMIALTNNNFRSTYKSIDMPSESERAKTKIVLLDAHYLNKSILEAVEHELKDRINNLSKEYSWVDRFSFIRTVDIPLDDYKDLISLVEKKIYNPFKLNEKQDVLGRAYRIFLSRSGKVDNKNIILTPDHIKDLMLKLARLDIDDVVLDTCTGSGGFLMGAMETMISLANKNDKIISDIQNKQLIGFETDPVLFALACSNMFLHGDGRSNMLYRSSLLNMENKQDKILFKYIKKKKPNKIIINPPYENNSAIMFTKQAINFLEKDGKLIIIMPSPTLQQNIGGLTDEILNEAKLDFVIKLPVDIFREQNRTVYTSIYGFTKTKHKQDDKVLFYTLDSDGLVSVQHKGRIDKFNRWPQIEKDIIDTVENKKEIPNVSQNKSIYVDGILNCSGYQVKRKSKFKTVYFKDIFNIEWGNVASEDAKEGDYDLITAGSEIKKHNEFTHDTEAIIYAVSAGGSLGNSHYYKGKFSASNLCLILTEKNPDKYPLNMRFYSTYLNAIKKQVIFDLADGTSKLTINDKELSNYKIDYIPISKQNDFTTKKLVKVDNLIKQVKKSEKDIEDSLYKLLN